MGELVRTPQNNRNQVQLSIKGVNLCLSWNLKSEKYLGLGKDSSWTEEVIGSLMALSFVTTSSIPR